MKMSNLKPLYILALCFILTGCEDFFESTIELDPPPFEEKIAIHLFGSTESPIMTASIFAHYPIEEDKTLQETSLDDAQLNFYKNGNLRGTFQLLQSGSLQNYGFDNVEDLEEGQTYAIEVTHPDYPDVYRASQVVPFKSPLMDLGFQEEGGVDIDGDEASEVSVVFQDPADEVNYYEATILLQDDFSERYYDTYTSSTDPSASRGHLYDALVISDESFNGEKKRLNLQMYRTSEAELEGKLFVRWRNVTEDYYRFARSLNRFDEIGENPFTSPIQIYSNIENGTGIFSLYSEQIVQVDI